MPKQFQTQPNNNEKFDDYDKFIPILRLYPAKRVPHMTTTISLNFYVANNFGTEYQDIFYELTQRLIDCANKMTEAKITVLSERFKRALIELSVNYLLIHFEQEYFEYFFQHTEKECYMIINNVFKHATFDNGPGLLLYNKFLYNYRIH